MSTTTLNIQVAQSRTEPRGAGALGSLFVAALNLVSKLFAKAPDVSHRQAAIDAAEVRALAYSMASTNPGVSADLLAAVDRHEARLGL